MPIHDWTRMLTGDFHDFHQSWLVNIRNALNGGGLPPEYMAMVEQGGVTVADAPPSARVVARVERAIYQRRKNRVVIRHGRGEVVAILEVVSPGNKDSRHAITTFVRKACDVLHQGVSLLVIDLFPPSVRDPQGIHKAIWDEYAGEEPFDFLPDKPMTVAS